MDREIKFRGKRLDGAGWVYGYYLPLRHDDNSHMHYFIVPLDENTETPDEGLLIEVDSETVSQYTDFKDKNGVEIYEKDIIRINELTFNSSGKLPENLNVVFCYGEFQLFRGKQSLMGLNLLYIKDGEVIGNTTDNPDLLES